MLQTGTRENPFDALQFHSQACHWAEPIRALLACPKAQAIFGACENAIPEAEPTSAWQDQNVRPKSMLAL